MKHSAGTKLFNRLQYQVRSQKLLAKKDRILVAVSGGPDSTALLCLLLSIRDAWKLDLGIVHVNHLIRGKQSLNDERFVRQLAKKSKVPFYGIRGKIDRVKRDERASIEEAARKVRYEGFLDTAKKYRYRKIATAHTQDDQAETVLMRILQGTGLRGLSGIRSKLKKEGIVFIRPFLEIQKSEILDYLRSNRLPFRIDLTNRSSRFVRNRIRNCLVPQLKRDFNPRVVQTLARIPAIVEEENRLFAELEEVAWKRAFRFRRKKKLGLNRSAFLRYPSSLQFRVLDRALKRLDPRSGLGFDAWQRIRRALDKPRYRCSLPRDIDFEVTPLHVEIYKKTSG